MCAITITFTGLGLLIRLCKPWTVLTGFLYGTMALVCVLAMIIMPGFFEIGAINLTQKLFIIILAIISPTLINFIYKLFEKIKI